MLDSMKMICEKVWKWYVRRYENGMLELWRYENGMLEGMKMVCWKVWKWYVRRYANGMLEGMKMVY